MKASDVAAFQQLIATPDPPELGPQGRPHTLPLAALDQALDQFFQAHLVPPQSARALRAAALLWHDHLDESHQISQGLPDSNGSFLHGIMHRREPDYSNAKYWFRQVGDHAAFPIIAGQVTDLLQSQNDRLPLFRMVVPNQRWDPFAFVDACQASAGSASAGAERQLLRHIQAIEFNSLLWLL